MLLVEVTSRTLLSPQRAPVSDGRRETGALLGDASDDPTVDCHHSPAGGPCGGRAARAFSRVRTPRVSVAEVCSVAAVALVEFALVEHPAGAGADQLADLDVEALAGDVDEVAGAVRVTEELADAGAVAVAVGRERQVVEEVPQLAGHVVRHVGRCREAELQERVVDVGLAVAELLEDELHGALEDGLVLVVDGVALEVHDQQRQDVEVTGHGDDALCAVVDREAERLDEHVEVREGVLLDELHQHGAGELVVQIEVQRQRRTPRLDLCLVVDRGDGHGVVPSGLSLARGEPVGLYPDRKKFLPGSPVSSISLPGLKA